VQQLLAVDVLHPCQHAEPCLPEDRLDMPEVVADVVLSDEVDGIARDLLRLCGADHMFEQHLSGNPVAEVFRPHEPRRMHRDDRDAEVCTAASADRVKVLSDEAAHAGRIDEDRLRCDPVHYLTDRAGELLFRAIDNVQFGHIRGEAPTVEVSLGRERAPSFP